MVKGRFVWIPLALVTIGPTACGDSGAEASTTQGASETETATTEDGGGTGDSGETGETGGAGQVTISGWVGLWDGEGGIGGAELCWVEGDAVGPCTTSASSGSYELAGVPAQTQGALRIVDDLVAPYAEILRTGQGDIVGLDFNMDSPERLAMYFTQAEVQALPGTVAVLSQLRESPWDGYTFDLSPASGDGPFYWRSGANVDPSATTTGSFGVGLRLNVDPAEGPFDLSFSKDTTTCATPVYGVGPLDSWQVPAGVELVYVTYSCEQQ